MTTNAELAKLALQHYDAELNELCHRDSELNGLRGTYEYLAQEADAAEAESEDAEHGESRVPLHRRPGPLQDAYQAYRQRLHAIAGE